MQTRTAQSIAKGLGWFSVGLGAAEIVAPRAFTRTFGTRDRPMLVRTLYGLREIGVGVNLLTRGDPTPWLWARLAGDVLDIGTLANTIRKPDARKGVALAALGVMLGVAALDFLMADHLSEA